ncbi:MAG: helix-turn-helix domain-containing protein [Candidatus Pacebacteria bacterium]|nr:helix-turn-helix domain-containing protein [Candidatus Paceibacterota bacterium]
MDKEKILQTLNLNQKEAKIYLAALSLGGASVTGLSRKAGLKRPTAYLIIDELLKKHLLVKAPQGKKVIYKPVNPDMLGERLEKQRQYFSLIVPELRSLYASSLKQPKARLYEGKEGIFHVQEEMCRAKEIWAVFSPENFLKVFSHRDNRHFFRILVRSGGIIYDMLEDTKKAREFARATYRAGVSEVRFLPKELRFSTDIWTHGDKVVMISFENLTAIVIEDASIASTQQQLLRFIWQKLPPG